MTIRTKPLTSHHLIAALVDNGLSEYAAKTLVDQIWVHQNPLNDAAIERMARTEILNVYLLLRQRVDAVKVQLDALESAALYSNLNLGLEYEHFRRVRDAQSHEAAQDEIGHIEDEISATAALETA